MSGQHSGVIRTTARPQGQQTSSVRPPWATTLDRDADEPSAPFGSRVHVAHTERPLVAALAAAAQGSASRTGAAAPDRAPDLAPQPAPAQSAPSASHSASPTHAGPAPVSLPGGVLAGPPPTDPPRRALNARNRVPGRLSDVPATAEAAPQGAAPLPQHGSVAMTRSGQPQRAGAAVTRQRSVPSPSDTSSVRTPPHGPRHSTQQSPPLRTASQPTTLALPPQSEVTPGPTLRPPGIPRSKSHTPSWRPTAAWDSSPASHLSASPHTPHDPAALLDPYHHTTHHEDPSNPYTDQQSTYRPAQGPASHSTHSTGQGAAGHSTRLVLPGDEGGVGGYEGPRSGSRGVTRGVGSGDRLAGGAQGLPAGAMGAGLAASPGGPPAPSAASGARKAAVSAAEHAALASEAQELRQEVAYLKQLLGVTTAAQAVAKDLPEQQSPATLTRIRTQNWQLQRQLALMGAEMKAHTQLTGLAERCLGEVRTRLQELLPQDAGSGQALHGELDTAELVAMQRWAGNMLQRMQSEKAQMAGQLTRRGLLQQAQEPLPAHTARGGRSYHADDSSGAAPTWQLPWMPVAGNRHLAASMAAAAAAAADAAGADSTQLHSHSRSPQQESQPAQPEAAMAAALAAAADVAAQCTLVRIAQGQAAADHVSQPAAEPSSCGQPTDRLLQLLTAEPAAGHQLGAQLSELAPRLASLAVLLRTTVLPALPWLADEASDRVQVEVSEAAETVSQVSKRICSTLTLLPGGPAALSGAETRADLARRGEQVSAGRDAWLWSQEPKKTVSNGVCEPQQYSDACSLDVNAFLGAAAPLIKQKQSGLIELRTLVDSLLAGPLRNGQKRLDLLDQELKFCCRTTALQAQHVQHLIQSVLTELRQVKAGSAQTQLTSAYDSGSATLCLSDGDAHMQTLRALVVDIDAFERELGERQLARLVERLQSTRPALSAALTALQRAGSVATSDWTPAQAAARVERALEAAGVPGFRRLL